jgi:deazaflavin-dependent oxidoreductase (nitroreductase family)
VAHAEPEFLYLTTAGRRSGLLREIEIWFTTRHKRHYLVAEHGARANWVQNIRAEPRVRFRIGSRTHRGLARVVEARTEPELAAAVRRLSEKKYGWGRGLVVELTSVE